MLIMMLCDRNDYDDTVAQGEVRLRCGHRERNNDHSLFTPIETDQKDQKEMKHGVV